MIPAQTQFQKTKKLWDDLNQPERDIVCGIAEELGGIWTEKVKRKNPLNYRAYGVVNYPVYMTIHGQGRRGSRDYSDISNDHPIMQYLRAVLSEDQYKEFIFHKEMTPIEFKATAFKIAEKTGKHWIFDLLPDRVVS